MHTKIPGSNIFQEEANKTLYCCKLILLLLHWQLLYYLFLSVLKKTLPDVKFSCPPVLPNRDDCKIIVSNGSQKKLQHNCVNQFTQLKFRMTRMYPDTRTHHILLLIHIPLLSWHFKGNKGELLPALSSTETYLFDLASLLYGLIYCYKPSLVSFYGYNLDCYELNYFC